jgi:hypothetical protein
MAVSVNFDRVLNAAPATPLPTQPAIPTLPNEPGIVRTLPPVPKRIVTSQPKNADAIRQRIAEQQRSARRRLETLLRRLYIREIRAYEAELRRELDGWSATSAGELQERMHDLFLKYAEERGPKFTRLVFLIGYPDPNPANDPEKEAKVGPPDYMVPRKIISGEIEDPAKLRFDAARLAEIRRTRDEIRKLDSDLDAATKALALGRDAEQGRRLMAMAEQVARRMTELENQASAEAAKLIADAQRELDLRLARGVKMTFPAEPSMELRTPAAPTLAPPPRVTSQAEGADLATRRARLETQVRIWIATQGYELSNRGPDRTDEFIAWRRSRELSL